MKNKFVLKMRYGKANLLRPALDVDGILSLIERNYKSLVAQNFFINFADRPPGEKWEAVFTIYDENRKIIMPKSLGGTLDMEKLKLGI